jgi:hypothetical protein
MYVIMYVKHVLEYVCWVIKFLLILVVYKAISESISIRDKLFVKSCIYR